MKTIEIIVPCHNEEKCITLFYEAIHNLFVECDMLHLYKYKITFVDDGSSDHTLDEIKRLKKEKEEKGSHNTIKYISFSRNFGKEAAIYAGLENSTGDYVVLMDADLQHPPSLIPEMLRAVNEEGYDCATARRVDRKKESSLRRRGSNMFFRLFCHITGLRLLPGSTDFRLMTRGVVNAILAMPEKERFIKGIYSWIGFHNKWVEYANVERVAGETKWNSRSLFRYAWNGFVAFATTPLRVVIYFGILVVLAAVVAAVWVFVTASINGTSGNGFATIMIAMLLLNGVIIMILGIIGEYLARIYMEVKNRPIYIVREAEIVDETSHE